MMKSRAAMLAGCLLAGYAALPAQGGSSPGGGLPEEIVVEIPGKAVGLTMMLPAGETAKIFVLFRPAPPPKEPAGEEEPPREAECKTVDAEDRASGKPLALAAIDLGGGSSSRVIATDLPADAGGIVAMDVDLDGRLELIMSRPGLLARLDVAGNALLAGAPVDLVADPDLDATIARRAARDGVDIEAGGHLAVPVLGGVRFLRAASRGDMALGEVIDLPLVALRQGQSLRLKSPIPRRVGGSPGKHPLYAAGPEPHGHRRLRTLLVDPEARDETGRSEWWSKLPGPEKIIESHYTLLDGRPALIVTTRPADKLSFFGEKLLRVFHVDEPDRSRTGAEPLFAVETHINLWQRAEPAVLDVNEDGREDLVVGYWKGIKDDTLVLDAYLREPDGSFSRSPRSTKLDLEDADRSVLGFGADLDGDGKSDLLLHAGGRGLVYPGIFEAPGKGPLVAAEPRWSFPWRTDGDDGDMSFEIGDDEEDNWMRLRRSGYGSSRIVDLEGDGRKELIFLEAAGEGREQLKVIRLGRRRPPGPS